jgi:cell division GTPase FtsZ
MNPLTARFPIVIKVVGVESGGIDILSRLHGVNLQGVDLIATSRDAAVLSRCPIGKKIHFDPRRNSDVTGSGPKLSKSAASNGEAGFQQALQNADMIFVVVTENDEPEVVLVIHKIARKMGVLVTAVANYPSTFGDPANVHAARDRRLRTLREGVDTLLIMRDDAPLYEILTALGA